MSPRLRNLLEDAADDGGRPVALDLATVRAAGRRALWRQRVAVGGGALGAVAVITSVALVLGSGSGSGLGGPAGGLRPAAPGSVTPSSEDTSAGESPPSWDDAIAPVVDAIQANGYDVELGYQGTHVMHDAPPGQEDEDLGILTASTMAVVAGDAAGAATVAEFDDVSIVMDSVYGDVDPPLSRSEVDGFDYTEQCAVLPANIHRADFGWDTCEESSDGSERVATGGDTYGDAVGVTLVRADGSGVSIAVSTAGFDRPVGGGPPTAPTLDEVPLSTAELLAAAELMLEAGPAFPEDVVAAPAPTTPVPPSAPPPPESTAVPDDALACPDEGIVASLSDAVGSSRLVEQSGRRYLCMGASIPDAPTAATDITDWTAPPLDAEQLGLGYSNLCATSVPCNDALWYGGGVLPDDVVRLTYGMPDGSTVEAEVAGRLWIFRHTTDAETYDYPSVIVRAYAANGSVLLEGEVNAPPG